MFGGGGGMPIPYGMMGNLMGGLGGGRGGRRGNQGGVNPWFIMAGAVHRLHA
jgi:hypothetical protein